MKLPTVPHLGAFPTPPAFGLFAALTFSPPDAAQPVELVSSTTAGAGALEVVQSGIPYWPLMVGVFFAFGALRWGRGWVNRPAGRAGCSSGFVGGVFRGLAPNFIFRGLLLKLKSPQGRPFTIEITLVIIPSSQLYPLPAFSLPPPLCHSKHSINNNNY